jgi:hypothetical protein
MEEKQVSSSADPVKLKVEWAPELAQDLESVIGYGTPDAQDLLAYLKNNDNEASIVDVKTTPGNTEMTPEQAKKFAAQLKRYYYSTRGARPNKHTKGRKVGKDIIAKRITAKKAKRRESNESRKINQKWNKK